MRDIGSHAVAEDEARDKTKHIVMLTIIGSSNPRCTSATISWGMISCQAFRADDRLLILARPADAHHAAGTRKVSAARLAPTSGEVVTEFQSDSARTDSPVRVRYAQPGSPVSGRHGWVRKMLPTRPRPSLVQTKKGRPFMPARSSLVTLEAKPLSSRVALSFRNTRRAGCVASAAPASSSSMLGP
jgi:hypothetical protein